MTHRAKQAALFTIFKKINHELGHRGNYIYGDGTGNDGSLPEKYTMHNGFVLYPQKESGRAVEHFIIGNPTSIGNNNNEKVIGINSMRISYEQIDNKSWGILSPLPTVPQNAPTRNDYDDYNKVINQMEKISE